MFYGQPVTHLIRPHASGPACGSTSAESQTADRALVDCFACLCHRETRQQFTERTGFVVLSHKYHYLRPDLSNVSLCGRVNFNHIPDADLARPAPLNPTPCRVCRDLADGSWRRHVDARWAASPPNPAPAPVASA